MITACLLIINATLTFSQDCPKQCTRLPVQEWTKRMTKTIMMPAGKGLKPIQSYTFLMEHEVYRAMGKECMREIK